MSPISSVTSPSQLIAATPPRKLFPGEDRGDYEAFRLAVLAELAPSTFYEQQLAENLVDLEWEAVRYRNVRTALVTAGARDGSATVIEDSISPFSEKPSKRSIAIAGELFEPDGPGKEAVSIINDIGTNLDEIVARAYAKEIGTLSHIERHLADIEPRRRRLLDDYDRLKARRSQNIPDAEIVDDNGN